MSSSIERQHYHIQEIYSLFLQVPPKNVIVSAVLSLKSWPAFEVQHELFELLNPSLRSFPPNKKWLSAVLKEIANDIEANDGVDVDDILAELIVWNHCRENDEFGTSYATYTLPSSTENVILKTYRCHNQVGTKVWEAGLYLADYFIHNSDNYRIFDANKKSLHILELGAGVGITGLILARLFPSWSITLTDYSLEVLGLIRENADINQMNTDRVRVQLLDWSMMRDYDEHDLSMITPPHIILAADCTYSIDIIDDLVDTIYRLLLISSSTTYKACAYIACTLRTQETFEFFRNALKALDRIECNDVTMSDEESQTPFYYENREMIKLYRLHLQ